MFLEKSNGKRNRAYRRHQRRKAIAHKLYIVKHIQNWHEDFLTKSFVGQLDKGKVHCSCHMCKFEKHFKMEQHKYMSDRLLREKEIKDYLSGTYLKQK